MDVQNQKISVIGAARSGISAAGVLKRLGAQVLLSDSQDARMLGSERVAEITALGVPFVLGASVEDALPEGTERVITSPGVPQTAPILQAAAARRLPIWSEIELAYRLTTAPNVASPVVASPVVATPIVATTGTNGKTTTTLLIAAMLATGGYNAVVAGNVSADEIKQTLVDAAYETHVRRDDRTVLVAEISSFQLEWVEKFAPHVGVLTNITPDHLNRYANFEAYAQTKARLFAAQTALDRAVLNYDDPVVRAIGERIPPERRVWVSLHADALPGSCARIVNGVLTLQLEDEPTAVLPVAEMPASLPGHHNMYNALAAATAARLLDVDAPAIARALDGFRGVAHRMEIVDTIAGVTYINNSMCTNVAAMIASLHALDRPAIVIAGGVDKGLDFTPLLPTLHQHVRKVVLIGSAAEKMAATFCAGGFDALEQAETLEAAVALARRSAHPGEIVILSPGCASFDMFRDFEARGAAFRNAVRAVREETA